MNQCHPNKCNFLKNEVSTQLHWFPRRHFYHMKKKCIFNKEEQCIFPFCYSLVFFWGSLFPLCHTTPCFSWEPSTFFRECSKLVAAPATTKSKQTKIPWWRRRVSPKSVFTYFPPWEYDGLLKKNAPFVSIPVFNGIHCQWYYVFKVEAILVVQVTSLVEWKMFWIESQGIWPLGPTFSFSCVTCSKSLNFSEPKSLHL